MAAASEEELELERALRSVGDAAGYWLLYDQSTGHWLRQRTFVDVADGTAPEFLYELWVRDVRDDLVGRNLFGGSGFPGINQVRYLGLIHGDKPDLSLARVKRADLLPEEYPNVPDDYDYYTVIADVLGERFMKEIVANSWVEAELGVLQWHIDEGYEVGEHIMIGGTIRGGPGCYDPECMTYTTVDGRPPSY